MPYFFVIFIIFFKKSKYFILFSKLYYYVTHFALIFGRNHVTFLEGRILTAIRDSFKIMRHVAFYYYSMTSVSNIFI